jgi:hypothetical protein
MPTQKVKTHPSHFYYQFFPCSENTKHPNNPETQPIVQSEETNWQETLYKYYIRINRLYKYITYYAWRFSEIHTYKLVLFIMVLLSVLKVNQILFYYYSENLIFVYLGMCV